MRPLSYLKTKIVPAGIRPLTILYGLFRQITLELSLQTEMQMYLGLFEKEIHSWIEALTRNIATAIDAGAAYGEYTVFFLMKTNADAVYAFEPGTDLHGRLRKNLQLNSLNGSNRLKLFSHCLGSATSEGVMSLDSLLSEISFPCFIKVDVDGEEEEILKGAERLNQRKGVRWLIETHSHNLEVACETRLRRANFKTVIIPNAWWRAVLPELRPVRHNRWLAAWNDDAMQRHGSISDVYRTFADDYDHPGAKLCSSISANLGKPFGNNPVNSLS